MREPDTDIRAFLERMALEAPLEPVGVGSAVRRAHRRVLVSWVGVTLVAALAIGGGMLAWERSNDAWMPAPAEPGPTFVSTDLPGLVLSTEFDVRAALGDHGLPRRLNAYRPREVTAGILNGSFSLSASGLAEAGMQGGYLGWFGTPGFGRTEGGTSLVSFVLLFPDAAAADQALDVIYADGQETWNIFRSSPTAGLGDEGWTAGGRLWAAPGLAIVWRSGNAVFFLASQGHFSPEDFRRLAGEVDRRARAAG